MTRFQSHIAVTLNETTGTVALRNLRSYCMAAWRHDKPARDRMGLLAIWLDRALQKHLSLDRNGLTSVMISVRDSAGACGRLFRMK